jgi:hypothetical protein
MTTTILPVAGILLGSFIFAGLGGFVIAFSLRGFEHHRRMLLLRHDGLPA